VLGTNRLGTSFLNFELHFQLRALCSGTVGLLRVLYFFTAFQVNYEACRWSLTLQAQLVTDDPDTRPIEYRYSQRDNPSAEIPATVM
jgi:hypothetical protein